MYKVQPTWSSWIVCIASYVIDVSIISVRVWKELSWAANFVDNAIVTDLPLLDLITMQVYVQPRVVKPTEYIISCITDSDPEETD